MDAGTMMLVGTGVQAGAKIAGGLAAQRAGRYNAAALDQQGAQEVAAAQRTAEERRLDTERLISKQIAAGAASGAGFGPSLLDVIGDTAQQGEYRAQADKYQGLERARTLHDRGRVARWEGDNAFLGSILEGIGTIGTGGARYGMNFGTAGTGYDPTWRRTTVRYG